MPGPLDDVKLNATKPILSRHYKPCDAPLTVRRPLPRLNLTSTVLRAQPQAAHDDSDEDLIDSLDWNLEADDDDYVAKGAKKYIGYSAMEKAAKKIRKEEEALLAKASPAAAAAVVNRPKRRSDGEQIPQPLGTAAAANCPEPRAWIGAKTPAATAAATTSNRTNTPAGESTPDTHSDEQTRQSDHDQMNIKEILKQLTHVEKMLLDIDML